MKKLWLFLIVGIFMVGAVSAEQNSCASSDDIIMKLSSASNAHGALWNDGDYGWDICYDDIFGVSGTGNRICSNPILWLSDVSNAHAENPNINSYPTGVCYDDLSCSNETISGTGNCSDGSEPILSLSSGTNAHMAAGNFDGYDTKICCVVVSVLYWADANGNEITTEIPNIGDTIQAVATNTGSGIFNIREFSGVNRNILNITGDGASGDLVGKWRITQADLDLAGGINSIDRFAFEVDSSGEYSDEIAINGTYDDSPMNITIISPACASNYSQGAEVTIEILAEDDDDIIEGNVTIGGVVVENFTNGGVVFNYTFSSSGNVQVLVEGLNNRGKRGRHIANVMIVNLAVDGSYVSACIDKPKDFSNMDDAVVEFDASTTRAILVSSGVSTSFSPIANPTNFSWYWRFMPEDIVREFVNSADSLAYAFIAEFPIAGDNSASLRVEFE